MSYDIHEFSTISKSNDHMQIVCLIYFDFPVNLVELLFAQQG